MLIFLRYWKYILVFILGITLGSYITYNYFPKVNTETRQAAPIYIKAETEATKDIAVVPIDNPGEVVKIVNKGTSVSAVIDGKEYTVPNTSGSTQVKLGEDSTLQIVEKTEGKLDITDIVNERLQAELELERMKWKKEQKHFGVGAIVSNKGSAPKVSYENANYEVGVFHTPNFYGGEFEYKF
jgi:hypothetical protein